MDKLRDLLGSATETAKEAIVGTQPDPDLRREVLEAAKEAKVKKEELAAEHSGHGGLRWLVGLKLIG